MAHDPHKSDQPHARQDGPDRPDATDAAKPAKPHKPDRPREPDAAMIAQAVAGDRSALAQILKALGPIIRAKVVPQIGAVWRAHIDPDDVMQVTYLEAFLKISKFVNRGDTAAAMTAWLAQIAHNNLRDAIKELERAKRPDPRKQLRDSGGGGRGGAGDSYVALVELLGVNNSTPSMQAARGELSMAIDDAIAQLPRDYATAIRLYDLNGHSAHEVGARMGKSAGAVYMLLARARERLHEILGSESRFFTRTS